MSGTLQTFVDFRTMGDDAARFRQRARDCRQIAEEAKSPIWRESLLSIAQDLEDEADRLDAEEEASSPFAPLILVGLGG